MPAHKKQIDENNILLPLFREYPSGLSTGEIGDLIGVSRVTARKLLLLLQKAGLITETGVSNRCIAGEPTSRNPKGRSNYNEWILTPRQYKKMQKKLFDTDYFQGYADFTVKILFGQPAEVPENVDLLESYGYVENKKGTWKLTNKGIELVVEVLKERGKEEE